LVEQPQQQCRNPLNPNCGNKNIAVYLQVDQDRLPLCQQCWFSLAETELDWNKENLVVKK
jgi:hypothetical protein